MHHCVSQTGFCILVSGGLGRGGWGGVGDRMGWAGVGKGLGRGLGKGLGQGWGRGWGRVGEGLGRVWISILQETRLKNQINVPWENSLTAHADSQSTDVVFMGAEEQC